MVPSPVAVAPIATRQASVCSGYPPQFPVTADDRRDVTFPRLNRACWYLYMVGGLFTIAALLAGVVAR
jgi:hypothetical protein